MSPLTEFIVSVSSSLSTLLLIGLLRAVLKLRKIAEKLMTEHRYLMSTMQLVLQHIGLEALIRKDEKS